MKKKFNTSTSILTGIGFVKTTIPLLLIVVFQSIGLGQVYSSTYVSFSGDSVSATGSVTGYSNSSTHVYTTTVSLTSPTGRNSSASNGGDSATTSLSISGEVGTFNASTQHIGTCPSQYGGGTHPVGGSGGSIQTCTDTCTACQALRDTQTGTCNINLTQCEGAAGVAYIAALLACENNAFCQSGNPNFNEEECNRCKQTVTAGFVAATAVCGTIYYQCLGNRVDCTASNYKTIKCEACSNP